MRKLLCLLLLITVQGVSQPNVKSDTGRISPELYIEMFKAAAIADMLKTGVPASITLAQGMYESDYGNSPLAKTANNHFGIKCHKDWSGGTYHQDDDAPNECFRKYESVNESYDDHSYFLRSRERYHFLFDLEITDYKGWAHGLKRAGYATNPAYASRLIGLIERYKLHEHDAQGVKMPITPASPQTGAVPPGPKPATRVKPERRESASSGKASAPPAAAGNTVNGVHFVVVKKGDTWTKIARDNNIDLWQVLEFNDASKNDVLAENDRIFIEPKKNRSETFTHDVREGDTMHAISQLYAIKLSRLYRMNEMPFGTEPKPGDKVYLKRAMLLGVVL